MIGCVENADYKIGMSLGILVPMLFTYIDFFFIWCSFYRDIFNVVQILYLQFVMIWLSFFLQYDLQYGIQYYKI